MTVVKRSDTTGIGHDDNDAIKIVKTTPEGSQRLAGGRAQLDHRWRSGDDDVNTMA